MPCIEYINLPACSFSILYVVWNLHVYVVGFHFENVNFFLASDAIRLFFKYIIF